MIERNEYYEMYPLDWPIVWGYYTYIGYDPDTRLYKIGSSGQLKVRQNALRREHPNFFMFAAAPRYIERHLHTILETRKIEGEWFDLNDIIHSVIEAADFCLFSPYTVPSFNQGHYFYCIWPSLPNEPKNYNRDIDWAKRGFKFNAAL